MEAAKGKKDIIEPTFVYFPVVDGCAAIAKETGCDYFSVPVQLGVSVNDGSLDTLLIRYLQPSGAEKAINILGHANEYEKKLIAKCIEGLKGNIEKGIDFVANPPKKEESK